MGEFTVKTNQMAPIDSSVLEMADFAEVFFTTEADTNAKERIQVAEVAISESRRHFTVVGKGSDICLWEAPPSAALSSSRAKDALLECGPGFRRSLTGMAPKWATEAMQHALRGCPNNIARDIQSLGWVYQGEGRGSEINIRMEPLPDVAQGQGRRMRTE